jgi:hypothetical protein
VGYQGIERRKTRPGPKTKRSVIVLKVNEGGVMAWLTCRPSMVQLSLNFDAGKAVDFCRRGCPEFGKEFKWLQGAMLGAKVSAITQRTVWLRASDRPSDRR